MRVLSVFSSLFNNENFFSLTYILYPPPHLRYYTLNWTITNKTPFNGFTIMLWENYISFLQVCHNKCPRGPVVLGGKAQLDFWYASIII